MASVSFYKNNKTWNVRYRALENGAISHKRKSGFRTKKEALEYGRRHENEITESNFTFDILVEKYLSYKKSRIKESSFYDSENLINIHIKPYFSKIPIENIGKKEIIDWQQNLTDSGYSYKYKSNIRMYLSSIFNFGIMYYDIKQNPVMQVERFRNLTPPKKIEIISGDEFKQIYNNTDRDIFKVLWAFLYLTGCRIGEALALKFSDVNNCVVNIDKNITRKTRTAFYIIVTPKNFSSIRKIAIPKELQNLISDMKIKYNLEDNDFVFFGKEPLADNTIRRKLHSSCDKANVHRISPHVFRHSHASFLISKGEDIVTIAKRLGHNDIETTLNVYGHLMPNKDIEILSKLNGII